MQPNKTLHYVTLAVLLAPTTSACGDAIVGRRYESSEVAAQSGASATLGTAKDLLAGAKGVDYVSIATGGRTSELGPSCPVGVAVTPAADNCVSGRALGDVDCNGRIDAVDALQVAQRAEGQHPPKLFEPAGDVDCDGCLTRNDANLISERSVGLITAFSCP